MLFAFGSYFPEFLKNFTAVFTTITIYRHLIIPSLKNYKKYILITNFSQTISVNLIGYKILLNIKR